MRNLLTKALILLAVFFMILSGCGFRGPLYMPKKETASSPQKSAASNPANTVVTPTVVKPMSK
jgi:predicted small lipoprotein YifL